MLQLGWQTQAHLLHPGLGVTKETITTSMNTTIINTTTLTTTTTTRVVSGVGVAFSGSSGAGVVFSCVDVVIMIVVVVFVVGSLLALHTRIRKEMGPGQ